MKYLIFAFVIMTLNAILAFALIIQAHEVLSDGFWVLGLIGLSLAVINAYCVIDGVEVISKKYKEYING